MNSQPQAKQGLILGTTLLAMAILIGAFGAHALKTMVLPEKLVTFETGVRYHFYHGLGIILVSLFHQVFPQSKISPVIYSFLIGIFLFSFNCYFYVLSDIKVFAMIVPVGGIMFVLGWIMFLRESLKLR